MNNFFKKTVLGFITVIVFVTMISSEASAMPSTLYQKSTEQTITSGATLEHISRFTTDGWLNIHVLRVDTANPNIKIDTLTNKQTTDKLSTVRTLAENSGAVAAVNASFFNAMGANLGYADGPIVQGGTLLSTVAWYNIKHNEMASFSLDDFGKISFDYWKNEITLTGSDNIGYAVSQYNQPSRQQYNDITIWDAKWGPSTLGVSASYPDLVEILVSDSSVLEIRQAQPAAFIPANGYVIISRGEQAAKLLQTIQVGETVNLNFDSTPDWSSLQMSVTGSSILLQEGCIPEKFSYSVSSFNQRNPRTIAGSSKDGKQLILVTVDGRQDDSIGLTQKETAELMKELGADNALLLDGGGSTTMVARTSGTNGLQVVNVPSEGSLRQVANAIGIFSLASPGTLAKLTIVTDDSNVFINTSRKFTLYGVDQNNNPVEIDPTQVKWGVEGIKGSFSGSIFRPTSVGSGKITAKIGEVTAKLDICALSAPVKLVLSVSRLNIAEGQSQDLKVWGYNLQGFRTQISPEDVKWTVNGKIGGCQNGLFKAAETGTGYIDAAIGTVHSYCAVAVSSETTAIKDSFEENTAIFAVDAQKALGTWELSGEQVHAGNTAGKLFYEFFNSGNKDEASILFLGKGITLDADSTALTVWVHNTRETSNCIMGEVVDVQGVKHQVQFTGALDWNGWKQLNASLDDIQDPAYLTRLYVQSTDLNENWGILYFDDLTAIESNHPIIDQSKIPQNTVPKDNANTAVTYKAGANRFRFAVFGSSIEPQNAKEKLNLSKMVTYINQNMDLAMFSGTKAAVLAKGVKKTALTTGNGYKTYRFKNSTFVQLDVSKGGLRRSDHQQWTWLFAELAKINGKNVFINMADSPAAFINSKEADLFKDTLADFQKKTGKNIWVFYSGSTTTSVMDRGVRYTSCAGFNTTSASGSQEAAKKVIVTVIGDKVTYEFKAL